MNEGGTDAEVLDTGARTTGGAIGAGAGAIGVGVEVVIVLNAGGIGTRDCAGGKADAVDGAVEADGPSNCVNNAGVS